MNTLKCKGLCVATVLLNITAACLPVSALASESTAPVAHTEGVLAAAASPAAFAVPARAAWRGLAATTPDSDASAASATPATFSSSASADGFDALPEAPQPVRVDAPALMFQASNTGTAPKYSMDIPSGWTAQRLSAGDKFILGVRNLANVESLAGTVISAGYSHLTDGQPNYGVDGTAFGQRFGAGVARSASQDIFTNSILAPVLHEDPRYYIEGSQYKFIHRVLYSITRPIIGRTDSGHTTVNASMLLGYAGAAALTPAYYPQINHNFRDVASTYGSSIGGAAIGFAVSEFSDQLLKAIHLKK